MEKVRPRCGQPSDRGRLKNRTEQSRLVLQPTLLNVLFKTLDGIFCTKLATMLERIAMVQSVRNTRLPTPQFTFIVKFQGQKVKFSQFYGFITLTYS